MKHQIKKNKTLYYCSQMFRAIQSFFYLPLIAMKEK